MNKTKIEWTEYTWKVITGCKHGCPYCYVQRWTKDMTPAFHKERLTEPFKLKKPSRIFVANTGDMFGAWVPSHWIYAVLLVIRNCPQHIFQLLTKAPENMIGWDFPPNAWVGATVTNEEDLPRIDAIRQTQADTKYISFEPILGYIEPDLSGIDWVIIGAESIHRADNPRDLESAQKWAGPLIEMVREAGIPLFLKDNLKWGEKIQEMPRGAIN